MGSAEGCIEWLPGYGDAGGQLQKLRFLPGCDDARMLPTTGGCSGLCEVCSVPTTKMWFLFLQYLVLFL